MAGKLKPLKHYRRRGDGSQTPSEMLSMLKTIGAGTNMTITRVKLNTGG